ncbi:unnamed protein product [Discula destructiva]
MASTEPLIRHATRNDVSAILGLIRELADYEHALSSVEATEATLLATIAFPPEQTTSTKPARCLLLFPPSSASQQQPVGMALYFYNYSTWRAKPGIYLEDLYVTPTERNNGYGRLLLKELAREVVAMEGGRLEWSVLKWNEPSIRFYEDVVKATRMEEWVGMRVDGEALTTLAGLGEGK